MSDQQQGDIEVVVGRIGKPHGIRGEVTLDVRTDEPDRRFAPGTTMRAQAPAGADRRPATLTVTRARWHQSTLLVTFEELDDRNAAEAARGTVLYATNSVVEMLGIPAVNVSHHLGVLRNARLIRGKKQGRCVMYSLCPGVLEDAVESGIPKEALNLGCCRLELPCEPTEPGL